MSPLSQLVSIILLPPQSVRPFQVQRTVDVSVEHSVPQEGVLANCTSAHVDATVILEENVQMQRRETTTLKNTILT